MAKLITAAPKWSRSTASRPTPGRTCWLKYAQAAKGRLKQGMRVQGEPKPAQALQSKLANAGIAPVIYPDMSQIMEF